MKKCNKCGIEKELEDFHKRKDSKDGYRNECKVCRNKSARGKYSPNSYKEYYNKNKDEILKYRKEYYNKNKDTVIKEYLENNKERITEYNKEHHLKNKEKYNERSIAYYHENKEHLKECKKVWKDNNPDKLKEYRENYRKKNSHIVAWRNVLKKSIRHLNVNKDSKTIEMLGYSAEDLKAHLESLFMPGMSWDNWGDWHIDHKIPLTAFDKDTPPHIVNSLENIQPLWASENKSKNNKVLEEYKSMEIYINYCN